jgi:cytochrome c biogenesis protein CcdA
MVDAPSFIFVVISAVIDAINPSAIAILIFIVSVLLGRGKSTAKMMLLGAAYIVGVFITYFGAGLGLLWAMANIPSVVAESVAAVIALIVITAGLLQLFSFFGIRTAPAIPTWVAKGVERAAKKGGGLTGALVLGVVVALVELACTGTPYLGITSVLRSHPGVTSIWLMVIYNLVFVAPLVAILVLVAGRTKVVHIQRWKEEGTPALRLGVGLMLVGLGWILMIVANGVIHIG